MTIRLLPEQVPQYWEYIKYAAVMASGHKDDSESKVKQFCLGLLINLMTDKYQCFFYLNDERKLQFIVIGRIIEDAGGVKSYFLEIVFGFEPLSEETKLKLFEPIKAFATNIGCDKVLSIASNPRVWVVAEQVGFKFYAKIHLLDLKGGEVNG